jgi:hypothetical protein
MSRRVASVLTSLQSCAEILGAATKQRRVNVKKINVYSTNCSICWLVGELQLYVYRILSIQNTHSPIQTPGVPTSMWKFIQLRVKLILNNLHYGAHYISNIRIGILSIIYSQIINHSMKRKTFKQKINHPRIHCYEGMKLLNFNDKRCG